MNWTSEQEEILRVNYPIMNFEELVELFGDRDRLCIANKAKRMGLHKSGTKHLRNKINSHFFSEPNLLNCYWAGFIMADGCVLHNRPNMLQIMLSAKDVCHLEQFKKDLSWSGSVITKKKKNKHNYIDVCCVNIIDEDITNDLKSNFNIVPRKTYTCEPPNLTDDALILAFIIGYADGDGSIYLEGVGKYPKLTLTGTYDLINWMKVYLDKHFPSKECYKNASLVDCKASEHCSSLTISTQRLVKFYEYMLTLNLPVLQRKWGRVEQSIKTKLVEKQDRINKQYSPHKHITFDKRRGRWSVQVYISRTYNEYIGSFLTEDEAVIALNNYLKQTSTILASTANF